MHFQISLLLWELQVIKDLLCVRDTAGISSNRLLLLLIFKKNQISYETDCVEVSFLIKLHDWGLATILRKHLTTLDMVLNTPLSHNLSIYYYNTDVCKDPNDYRSSHTEVFCKKGVLKNFANFILRPATLF